MNQQIYKDTTNPFWNVKLSALILIFISFVVISLIAVSGITKNLDDSISRFFSSIQNPSLDLIFIIITTTSDTINLLIAGFVLTVIKRTRRFGMILLISLVAITILVTYIKPLFGIDHPQQNFVPLIPLPEKFTLEQDSFMPFAQGYSYPSNHIASAVAFSFIIGGLSYRHSYRFAIGFLVSFPILIGFTKLYLFQHNLIDLIGGYLFGLIVVILIVKGLKANTETRKNKDEVQDADNKRGHGVKEWEEERRIESNAEEEERRIESNAEEEERRIEKKLNKELKAEKKGQPEKDEKDG